MEPPAATATATATATAAPASYNILKVNLQGITPSHTRRHRKAFIRLSQSIKPKSTPKTF